MSPKCLAWHTTCRLCVFWRQTTRATALCSIDWTEWTIANVVVCIQPHIALSSRIIIIFIQTDICGVFACVTVCLRQRNDSLKLYRLSSRINNHAQRGWKYFIFVFELLLQTLYTCVDATRDYAARKPHNKRWSQPQKAKRQTKKKYAATFQQRLNARPKQRAKERGLGKWSWITLKHLSECFVVGCYVSNNPSAVFRVGATLDEPNQAANIW